MTIVAAITVLALASTVAGFLRYVASQARQHARERQTLIDQVCHLSGRPWTPPPADQWPSWQTAADRRVDDPAAADAEPYTEDIS